METNTMVVYTILQSRRVLILPMRNGNCNFITELIFCHKVLILPMRNGNFLQSFDNRLAKLVLILPMRNGNTFLSVFYLSKFLCSYPTYEEWKHFYGARK